MNVEYVVRLITYFPYCKDAGRTAKKCILHLHIKTLTHKKYHLPSLKLTENFPLKLITLKKIYA